MSHDDLGCDVGPNDTNVVAAKPPTHEQAARALGARWALDVRQSLLSEKRRAAGGWPGTKSQALARATWLLATNQTASDHSSQPILASDLATTVYASAKATWLANAEAEDDDSDVEQ